LDNHDKIFIIPVGIFFLGVIKSGRLKNDLTSDKNKSKLYENKRKMIQKLSQMLDPEKK
jgi:hypothetical protein